MLGEYCVRELGSEFNLTTDASKVRRLSPSVPFASSSELDYPPSQKPTAARGVEKGLLPTFGARTTCQLVYRLVLVRIEESSNSVCESVRE